MVITFKEFISESSEKRVKRILDTEFAKHESSKPEHHLDATFSYTHDSQEWNQHLRSGGKPEEMHHEMDAAISHKTTNKLRLYRGIQHDHPIHKLNVGHKYTDPGYASTTGHYGIAKSFGSTKGGSIMHITLPKGSKAHHISHHTEPHEKEDGLETEHEVLLPRNTEFHIHKKYKDSDGQQHYHVTAKTP
jgi:hypothetical protein